MSRQILFEPKTFVDIMLAADVCEIEVSGLAKVQNTGETYIVNGDIAIFEQRCSLGGTHLDPVSVNLWLQKTRAEEIRNRTERSEIPLYRLWWHSHVDGITHPSSTDKQTMRNVWGPVHDWQIMMIVNRLRHTYLELDLFKENSQQRFIFGGNFNFTERFTYKDYLVMFERRRDIICEKVSANVNYNTDINPENL